ncbi:hypothetical protein DRW41_13985 [Neobacillus piezotolerans]|uniref:SHOCT domain-containing protein n=1 Tax=Neobacillus piezotolerans TaxID=2259171 RepID=A0A3D8GPQ1_9BACI|nr:hypothetical protein [Neobacillus piezotolerans]RDU36139.1 hypothetical protein DRW41_13985 [Neobacillus piezotolerans]
MAKKMIAFLLMMVLILPAAAFGEEIENGTLKLEELSIQVMPEFAKHPNDKETKRPPLLIGYQGSLINNTGKAQNGKIEIPLPVNEKNFRIGFVADYSSDLSQMFEINYELDLEKGIISWETSREIAPNDQYKFVIEFYTDAIKTKGNEKTLDYSFKSFADITLVNLTILEPMNAGNVKLEPAATEAPHENPYGLNMHTYQIKGMKAGQEKEFKLSYDRKETKTTNELLEAAGKSTPQAKAKKTEKMPLGLTVAGISAASLLACGLLILFLKKKFAPSSTVTASFEPEARTKKAQLRRLLMDGMITEEEYNELHKKLNL